MIEKMLLQKASILSSKLSWIQEVISHFLPPLLFIGFVFLVIPIQQPFEFDTDEGINLIKTLLYGNGFSLYQDIWNDQPPLLTVLLRHWMEGFGQSLFTARLLILSFSALLIGSFFQILRTVVGSLPALVGTLLLVVTNRFAQLSASVMIGMPSLALALVAIYCLVLYKKSHHKFFVILSGGLFACSLQTKIFTVFLIPILMLYLLDFKSFFQSQERRLYRQFQAVVIWSIAALTIYLLIGILFHSINYEQLVQAHFNQEVEQSFESRSGFRSLFELIKKDRNLALLAIAGSVTVFLKRQWDGLLPLSWLATAMVLLLNHQPIWYHHFMLIAIPMAWLSAYSVAPAFDVLLSRNWGARIRAFDVRGFILPAISLMLLIVALRGVPPKIGDIARTTLGPQDHHHDPRVVELLLESPSPIQWIFTDRPIYAFQANVQVPPEVAVFSLKRLRGGNLSFDEMLSVLETYKPERIVLARFKDRLLSDPIMHHYLNAEYSLQYQTDSVDLYNRKP